MIEFFSLLTPSILLVLVYMSVMFGIGTVLRNNGIVDVAWGLGFVCIAWFTGIASGTWGAPQIVVTFLVTVWGLRLAYHIGKRNIGKAEDFRYAQWRKDWGRWAIVRSFFQVYMLQGLFMLIIAVPIILINTVAISSGVMLASWIGLGVWVVGFFFEAVGDAQLRRFLHSPEHKGTLMTSGLWKYTRHPNYFGEAVMWWGIWLFALGIPFGWYAIVSPITITLLVRFVSGVPMLEKKYAGRADWEVYATRTNVFVPWFPKT
jgi:steroid 5-alpha reductase family enzyme